MDPAVAAEEHPAEMSCTDESPQGIDDTKPAEATPEQLQPNPPLTANTQLATQPPAAWASKTRIPITTPPAHPTLKANADFSKRARHLNNRVVPRPLAHPSKARDHPSIHR
jgi:hypothetical protein